jgi:hypothetical protein
MTRNIVGILTILAISLVIGLPNTYAQNVVTATVPFAFTVGGSDMPAGTYSISPVSETVIAITDRNSGKSVMSLARHEWAGSDGTPKLLFHKYGNKYFLSQVSRGFGSSPMQLPTSKQERELARELQIAKTGGKPETETIVATK